MNETQRQERVDLEMEDADVAFIPKFFSPDESNRFLESLFCGIKWKQETARMFGREIQIPRLTAWYGDPGKIYAYSGITHRPHPWTEDLREIKSRIEEVADCTFNSVLINRYRNGKDSVSWHSDDEPELGTNTVIGSVSFGETRRFQFKHKEDPSQRVTIDLVHGSFLLMKGPTQHFWLHQIPKSKNPIGERINLTFRVIR